MFSEKKFIVDGIKQGLRCDGRSPLNSRVLELKSNTELLAAGSSQINIELESPHVICGVKAEIADINEITLSIELAGKSSIYNRERFKEISVILEKLLLDHIEKSQFEILQEKKYWKIFIDVLVIDENASNLVEHIGISILEALRNTRVISVVGYVNKNTKEEFLEVAEGYWNLDISNVPVVISVSVTGENLVLDLNSEEEECVEATIHIAVDAHGNIRGIIKEGAGCLPFYQLLQTFTTAKAAAHQFFTRPNNLRIHYKV